MAVLSTMAMLYVPTVAHWAVVAATHQSPAGTGQCVVDQGQEVVLLTWLGDAANEALACLLRRRGYSANAVGPGIEVVKGDSSIESIVDTLIDAAVDEPPPLDMLLADVRNLQREKWDWALPDGLLRKAYASLYLNIEEALSWARALSGNHVFHSRES